MPVWPEETKALVAAGKLHVVAITQEQHPARTRLFAQWQGLDFPILWDPFNLTGSKVVPHFRGVDRHGVLRVARLKPGARVPSVGQIEVAEGAERLSDYAEGGAIPYDFVWFSDRAERPDPCEAFLKSRQ